MEGHGASREEEPPALGDSHAGLGDTELGVKYRMVSETSDCPQVGLFPLLEVPTGDETRNLGSGQVGAALLKEAGDIGADLVVMGAYTHSRLRQLILGGVTRHVLHAAQLPVLLCH